ncbi:hypothetical protein GGF31_001794 [Allomyces arbusculus]|nr:hypothetical protein GGF31_001794 [Allomyces arbusculus]
MLPSQTRSGGSGAAATMNSPAPTPILASSSVRAAAPGLTSTLAALAEDKPMTTADPPQGTGTQLPAQWRLTDHIRTVLTEPLQRIRDPTLNRFVAHLVNGSLAPALAAHWLKHDAVYLEAAARHVAHLVTLAPRSDLALLAKDLAGTVDELAWAHATQLTISGAADAPTGPTALADVTARMSALLDSTRAQAGPEAYALGMLAHWAMNMAFADAWRAVSAAGHADPHLAAVVEAMRARWTAPDWYAHLDTLALAVNAAFHDWVRSAQMKEGEAVDKVEKVARDAVGLEEAFFAAVGEGAEGAGPTVEKTMAAKVLEEARASQQQQPWMKVED